MNTPEETRLPESWVWTELGEILHRFESGSRPKGGVQNIDNGIPSIGGEHLSAKGGFNFFKIKYIPIGFFEKLSKGIIQNGDILIVKDGATTGKTSIIRDDFPFKDAAVNEHVFLIRPYQEINNLYVFHFLFSTKGQFFVRKNFKGTAQGGINLTFFGNTFLPLAPLPEQNRIVARIEQLFTNLDAGVESLKAARTQLKRYRQSVLKSACEGRLVPTEAELARAEGREYELAEVLLERILEERRRKWEEINKGKKKYKEPAVPDINGVPELPEGWVWKNMGGIGEVSGGLTKNSKRNKYPKKMPYIRVANVYSDKLKLDDINNIGMNENEINRVLLKKGDLLVVEGNGSIDQIGRAALWDGSISPCVHQNHIIKVRFNPVEIGKYMLIWMLSINGRKQITDVASSTSGLYTLSISKVSSIFIPLPPLPEQHRIVAEVERCLSVADEMEKTIEQSLKQAERLRQSILKRAFKGKLVPQDPNDEPAEVLLERIKEERAKREAEEKVKKRRITRNIKMMEVRKETKKVIKVEGLYDILLSSKKTMAPKELWQLSKLDIEEFYAQLKVEVEKGRVIESRPNDSD
ncbi:MAG: restriction endonuclease subunit S, partial [Deltaproteobacteria bacterium]|nr:restriction endonuclease subunit S [Deltaproteobacteria bacterium]